MPRSLTFIANSSQVKHGASISLTRLDDFFDSHGIFAPISLEKHLRGFTTFNGIDAESHSRKLSEVIEFDGSPV
jgi:hypothetical protein